MIKKKDVEEFKQLAQGLDGLIRKIRKYNLEANLYVGSDSLYLMDGPSHDYNDNAHQENVVAEQHIISLGGGDW